LCPGSEPIAHLLALAKQLNELIRELGSVFLVAFYNTYVVLQDGFGKLLSYHLLLKPYTLGRATRGAGYIST
jgi:hypothetical protein